ncbi:2OG-Fe(II) oxygenase superfamily [Leishmania donovani]|uniref:2OG-Fe(II)_oxygenase_superfamily_putative/Pfam:PF 13532/Pfam:PF03171 n=1 Tax=Leishmania donovani TaxID=5661 RepID=A0A6J8FGZ9_LEIDO|nr:2OG-Fe(II) oxygenase superfamily [Leishmania donovani]VDZ45493.1 2OG-Fe(II)_oxygenase_superfamily_putative/Pfam:PF13532/Pfam:PF03171 [Leishmania donovani]
MSLAGDPLDHLLPLLKLPPRQMKKTHISCKKWLARFFRIVAPEAGIQAHDGDAFGALAARLLPPHEQATGFVALNGGTHAGCTPYDLRQTLEAHGLLRCAAAATPQKCSCASPTAASATPLPSNGVLQHSSTLPFVVCSVPLQLPRDAVEGAGAGARALSHSVSVMHVAVAELAHFAASAEGASSCPSGADLRDDEVTQTGALVHTSPASSPAVDGAAADKASVMVVVVLQVPPNASLWKEASSSTSSSSAKKGCGFLYLVPCDAAAVRSRVAHLLQRPVVGIERLLPSSTSLSCAAAEEERGSQDCSSRARPTQSLSNGAAPPARTCTSQAVPDVPGLFLVEDFVTADEEKTIWHELHHGRPRLQMEYLSRRRVAHFNRRFLYGVNALTAEGDVTNARPSFYVWMRARLQNDMAAGGVRIDGDYPFRPGDHECDQLTVNYYDYSEVGACGIAAHVDAHNAFDDAVFIVSLGSYTVMEFSRWDAPAEVAAPVGVYLAPRSLVVIAGEARYGWTHCIAEKRTDTLSELLPTFSRGDRMSLTWRRGRTQRHTKAECPYPALCDGA